MAGTPTTNYNIPTYADTDAPDLSGAYNDAMVIIDTQLKANADAIESASTGDYTGNAPIVVNNEERTIGVAAAAVGTDGTGSASGVVAVTGKASAIGSGVELDSVVVPNVRAVADYVTAHGGTAYTAGTGISISEGKISAKTAYSITTASISTVEATGLPADSAGAVIATCTNSSVVDRLVAVDDAEHNWPGGAVPTVAVLKGYVESKMASAGAAYTGTAPIVVDNGSHTISVNQSKPQSDGTTGGPGTVSVTGKFSLINSEQLLDSSYVPNLRAVYDAIMTRTPDASASVKGLVRLDTDGASTTDATRALTAAGALSLMATVRNNVNARINVQDLAQNLYYSPSTGLVFCKPPTE